MSILVVFLVFLLTGVELFEAPKTAALRVCGAVALGLALGASRWPKLAQWTAVDFAAIGVLFAELVTTAASDSPLLSVVGEPTQREGLLTFASLGGVFLAARTGTKGAADARATVDALLTAAAIVCAYGLLQALGMDPISWERKLDIEGFRRPFGTMGHPNLLGVVSAMAFTMAVANAVLVPLRRARYVALALLFATITLATVSRAAWIAAALGGAVTWLAAARPRWRSPSTRRAPAIAAAVVLLSGALAFAGPGRLLRDRFADMLAGFSGSGATRREIWRTALAAWQASPWLGHGPDTFALVFPRYQTLRYWTVEWGGLPSHAHSIYLDALATRGVLGCVAYTAALVALVLALVSAWRAGGAVRDTAIPVAGAILAALLAGAFGALGASGVLALAVCAGTLAALGASARPRPAGDGYDEGRGVLRQVLPAIVLGCVATAWSTAETLAWRDVRTARDLAQTIVNASAESKRDLSSEAVAGVRRAAREMPADDRIETTRVEVLLAAKEGAENPDSILEEAETAARTAVRLAPLRSYAYEWLGVACMERARAGHAASLADGIAAYERSLELSPFGALAIRKYAQYMLVLGHRAEGLSLSERAAALYPDNGSVVWELARALAANRRMREARATLERSLTLSWLDGDPERTDAERAWKSLESGRQ